MNYYFHQSLFHFIQQTFNWALPDTPLSAKIMNMGNGPCSLKAPILTEEEDMEINDCNRDKRNDKNYMHRLENEE